jgi:hypothetical protein
VASSLSAELEEQPQLLQQQWLVALIDVSGALSRLLTPCLMSMIEHHLL